MIDFKNKKLFKLNKIDKEIGKAKIALLMVDNEYVISAFKSIRDYLVFTNKRAIAINAQGLTGKKVDYTSLPYSKIQAFSVETAGTFDLDAELTLTFSSLGSIKFDLKGSTDIRMLAKMIGQYIL